MKGMVPLRLVAIASNVALMSYLLLGLKFGIFGRLDPILAAADREGDPRAATCSDPEPAP